MNAKMRRNKSASVAQLANLWKTAILASQATQSIMSTKCIVSIRKCTPTLVDSKVSEGLFQDSLGGCRIKLHQHVLFYKTLKQRCQTHSKKGRVAAGVFVPTNLLSTENSPD